MKTYITPAVEVQEATPQAIIATSFKVSDIESDQQLSKEDTNWDIWGE